MFRNKIKNAKIIYNCDNQAVVDIINKQTSKEKRVIAIVGNLVLTMLEGNFSLHAQHIPGVDNILNDAISRF